MSKQILSVLLIFTILCCTSCGIDTGQAPVNTDNALEYTDDCGRKIMIPSDIDSIVASGPLSQIILMSIAPEMMRGLAVKWDDSAVGIISEEYLNLPVLGQLYDSSNLNIEELVSVAPDLIIDIGEAKPSLIEDMDRLQQQTGIPVIHIEASLGTMPKTYETLGVLLNKEEKGKILSQFLGDTYDRTIHILDKVGTNKVKTLYITGNNGESVVMKNSYHSEIIDMITDNPALSDTVSAKGLGTEVSIEQIALWNPDLIIFSSDTMYQNIKNMPAWKELEAIRNGNYVLVPSSPYNWLGTPPSVQMYLGMIWLTGILYPQYCDYDIKAKICEYYRLFYGCQLTDEQYERIITGTEVKQCTHL